MAHKRLKIAPEWPRVGPRWPQDGPRGPKTGREAPRRSKRAPRGPKKGLRGLKSAQEASKRQKSLGMFSLTSSAAFRSQLNQVLRFWGALLGFFFAVFLFFVLVAFCIVFGAPLGVHFGPSWGSKIVQVGLWNLRVFKNVVFHEIIQTATENQRF